MGAAMMEYAESLVAMVIPTFIRPETASNKHWLCENYELDRKTF